MDKYLNRHLSERQLIERTISRMDNCSNNKYSKGKLTEKSYYLEVRILLSYRNYHTVAKLHAKVLLLLKVVEYKYLLYCYR